MMVDVTDFTDGEMRECDNCGGSFLPEDMVEDYCRDCDEILFGDEA